MAFSAESKLLEDDLTSASNPNNVKALYMKKVGSAVFYGVASFFITVVNKTVLTSWKFPSFLTLSIGQMVAGIVILVSDDIDLMHFYHNEIQASIDCAVFMK